jgi:hypothetical protein
LLDQQVSGDATLEEAVESFLASLPQEEQAWAALGERYRVDLLCDLFIKGMNQGFESCSGGGGSRSPSTSFVNPMSRSEMRCKSGSV